VEIEEVAFNILRIKIGNQNIKAFNEIDLGK
jgi:hypothetical protein